MAKYKLTLNSNHNTSEYIEFEIPDEAGNYELWFQKEGFGSILVGDVSVGQRENVYNLRLGMSDGSEIDAGTFATPVVEEPFTTLTLYSEADITEQQYAPYLHFICRGEKPVVKFDGQVLTGYGDYPYPENAKNYNILSLALPFPFPAGTHTLTLEGGGPIYFGNVKADGSMPTTTLEFVGAVTNHATESAVVMGILVTDVVFGANYGDTLGSGAFRDVPMTQFKLQNKIKKLGSQAIAIGLISRTGSKKTIWLHNKIEHMDVISVPTTFAMSCAVYLPYSEDDEVLFDANNILGKGSSKGTMTWDIYTDNSTIKNGALSVVDEYTMVNVYHYDGSAWD